MEKLSLEKKYPDLPGSKSVERATLKARREGERIPDTKANRVETYLNRLERLALDPQKEQPKKTFGEEPRPRALSLLREMVMNKYVRPHKEKMAEGAARVEERAARELGIEAQYGEQELEQRGEIAVEDLEKSLDNWIAYLSDANEPYPVWFRYYVFRNILDLGDYDKDKGEFTKRSRGSTRLFPDIDRGALAYVEQMIEAASDPEMLERLRKAQQVAALENIPESQLITAEKAADFTKLPFARQYSDGIRQAGEITPEMREETRGKWVKYQQGTDPTALWASLQNKGAAWCTKGFGTAAQQLNGGDFYVYYTNDRQGKPTIPRVAIRMQGERIGEVRGVADSNQNLEGNMAPIAEEKMKELPGAEKYHKITADMKRMTTLTTMQENRTLFTASDLRFLYELDAPIEGFGYDRDPRIQKLRSRRNPKEDAPILFGCLPDQIAWNQHDITESTTAYIGSLFPGIFKLSLEHIYTRFPEGRIRFDTVSIGEQSPDEYRTALKAGGHQVYSGADYMLGKMEKPAFLGEIELVTLSVEALGFPQGATRATIYAKAIELGLELCPAQVGPALRLQYTDQPVGEWNLIGMEPITDSDGDPRVFDVDRDGDGSWLRDDGGHAVHFWRGDVRWVFARRKF